MRDFKIAVGNSLKDKIGELGFFLQQIIEYKHFSQDYPINAEVEKLNYFFSAYLNTIQSLKDGMQTATGKQFSWKELSPTYGDFIFYCRNATTHDGYHLINSGKSSKNYISGPLRRIDGNNKIIEFNPPKEDVFLLCRNMTNEILNSLIKFLENYGSDIPTLKETDFKKNIQESLKSEFIPEDIKNIIKNNLVEIEQSTKNIKINIIGQTIEAIKKVKIIVANIKIL